VISETVSETASQIVALNNSYWDFYELRNGKKEEDKGCCARG